MNGNAETLPQTAELTQAVKRERYLHREFYKRKTVRFLAVKNRGTRGDSLLMLSPLGLSNRKAPLLL